MNVPSVPDVNVAAGFARSVTDPTYVRCSDERSASSSCDRLRLSRSRRKFSANIRRASPDLVLVGGRIYTLDAARPWAEALAIGGREAYESQVVQVDEFAQQLTAGVELHDQAALGEVDLHRVRPFGQAAADLALEVVAQERPRSRRRRLRRRWCR